MEDFTKGGIFTEKEDSLVLSAYRDVADIRSDGHVKLVQNTCSGKFFVKKVLSVYHKGIYEWLLKNPVPGMPRIYFVTEDRDTLTVIEEYLSGDTLESILGEKGKLSLKETVHIAKSLCETVSVLHAQTPSIIHRDIKPANIIISSDGVVKLLDMNVARRYSEGETSDTQYMGTAGYAAPEQYGFGQSSTLTDIYSIGVLMSVCHFGKLPLEAGLTGKLGAVIKKCTALEPEKRYQNTAKLEKALGDVLPFDSLEKKPYYRFLLPGFRSLNPGNMLFALLGYTTLFSIGYYMTFDSFSPAGAWVSRIMMTLCLFSIVLFTGNYLEIQKYLPVVQSKNLIVKTLGILFYDALLFLVFLSLTVVLIELLPYFA